MNNLLSTLAILFVSVVAWAGEVSFTVRPNVTKVGEGVKIMFAVNAATDVEVAVLGTNDRIVRHLAAGVLGSSPPQAFQKNTLVQTLHWDGKDDFGQPAKGAPFRIRVALGLKPRLHKIIGWSPYSLGGVDGLATGPDGTLYLIHSDNLYAHRQTWLISAFDKNGKYLRACLKS